MWKQDCALRATWICITELEDKLDKERYCVIKQDASNEELACACGGEEHEEDSDKDDDIGWEEV